MLGHSHGHDEAHAHGPGAFSNTRTFAMVTLLNLAFTAVEAGYGFLTNSLALLTDALHNLGDVLGLGLAWAAAALAKRAIDKGVAFVPGTPFYAQSPDSSTLRLSFATADIPKIEEGIARLAQAF